MGGGNYNMNSSQFEFLKDEAYERKGGCFVTTPKAIIYVVIAMVSLVLVALLMYYYGPYSSVVKTVENPMDIEKLLNYSVGNISQDIRLPKYVEPTLYKLKLDPIENENISILQGEVHIRLRCLQRTKKIVLNAEKLNIITVQISRIDAVKNRTRRSPSEETEATETTQTELPTTTVTGDTVDGTITTITTTGTSVSDETTKLVTETPIVEVTTVRNEEMVNNGKIPGEIITTTDFNVTDHEYDAPNSKYIITLKKDLDPNKHYVLNVTFSSNISDVFLGLYRTVYKDNTSILATHLQPIYARKLFPCFDEPSFKSPIQLTIRKRPNTTILSNTALSRRFRDGDQGIWDEFETTPSIPMYLFGFIVGDFVKIQEEGHKPIIRVWGLKNSNVQAGDVIKFTKLILGRLEKYFDVSYPMGKIDIVAVKEQRITTTSAGLIFLKESLFLAAEDIEMKTELLSEIIKALTKEWIGNLVSVRWWSDFWLVNGFSLFMLEELHSEVSNWDSDFTLEVTQETLHADDLKSTPSLESQIENSIQIVDVSDKIKYNKGSCVLRMLNASLAPLTFKKGIQTFIKEWKGNSSDVEHFWQSFDLVLTKVDNLPQDVNVTDIMRSWISEPTYPLVTVIRDIATNGLNVSQSKIHLDKNDTSNSLWKIPIAYMIGNYDNVEIKHFWLTEKMAQIENVAKNKWVLFNVAQTGYYRVNYDLDNWKLLMNALYMNHLKIPVENRGQLINDAFDLAENGLLDYYVPFNLSRYLVNETNYIPWASALKSLNFIRSIVETTYLNGAYEDYITNLIGNIYDDISTGDDQDINRVKLRNLIVETACGVNYPNCTQWANEMLQKWINDPNSSINNRRTALCTGIRLSGRTEWETMFEKLQSEEINNGIEDLYMALGCTKDLWLINKYLDSTLNGTIPSQYVSLVWQSIHQIPSRTFGFKFLRENWEKIFDVYNEKRLILKTIIQEFLYTLSTKSDKEDLTLFFGKYEKNLQEFSYLLKGVVDRIDTRISWAEKHLKTIGTWLSSHKYK